MQTKAKDTISKRCFCNIFNWIIARSPLKTPILPKHMSIHTKWLRLEVNQAQQSPISCFSPLPCVCFHRALEIKDAIKGCSIWVIIFLVNNDKKTLEAAAWTSGLWCGGTWTKWKHQELFFFPVFLLCFSSSLSALLIKDNTACWHTESEYAGSRFAFDPGCP